MVYHEVMADWAKAMHLISGSNRVMEKLNFFGGRGKNKASEEERLVAEIEALERKVRGYGARARAVLERRWWCVRAFVKSRAFGVLIFISYIFTREDTNVAPWLFPLSLRGLIDSRVFCAKPKTRLDIIGTTRCRVCCVEEATVLW